MGTRNFRHMALMYLQELTLEGSFLGSNVRVINTVRLYFSTAWVMAQAKALFFLGPQTGQRHFLHMTRRYSRTSRPSFTITLVMHLFPQGARRLGSFFLPNSEPLLLHLRLLISSESESMLKSPFRGNEKKPNPAAQLHQGCGGIGFLFGKALPGAFCLPRRVDQKTWLPASADPRSTYAGFGLVYSWDRISRKEGSGTTTSEDRWMCHFWL